MQHDDNQDGTYQAEEMAEDMLCYKCPKHDECFRLNDGGASCVKMMEEYLKEKPIFPASRLK